MRSKLLLLAILLTIFLIPLVSAFSTLGISNIDYEDGKYWVVTVSDDGSSDVLVATKSLDNSEIRKGDVVAKNDVRIEMETTQSTCVYSFGGANQLLKTLSIIDRENVWGWESSAWRQECENKASSGWWFNDCGTFTCDMLCLGKRLDSSVSDILSASTSYVFKEDIKVVSGGISQNTCLSNNKQQTGCDEVEAVDGFLRAKWVGSFVTGSDCPDPFKTGVMGWYDGSSWHLVSKIAWNDYTSKADSKTRSCLDSASTSGEAEKCVGVYNNYAQRVKNEISFNPVNARENFKPTIKGGELLVEVNKLQNPVIQLKMDVAWVGVVEPEGKPDITSLESECFESGELGLIRGIFKNTGVGRDGFTITTVCDDPIKAEGQFTIQLDPNEESRERIDLQGVTSEATETSNCNVCMESRTTTEELCKSVKACVERIPICDEGNKRCLGDAIQVCDNNQWTDFKKCSEGFTCIDRIPEPVCEDKSEIGVPVVDGVICEPWIAIGGTTIIPNLGWTCSKAVRGTIIILAIVGGLIILGLIAWIYYKVKK